MAQGSKPKSVNILAKKCKSGPNPAISKRKSAPSKNKKHRKDVLTSAINRNIEAMVVEKADSAGTGLKLVSQHKQTVVRQRRKDLCKTLTNRIVRKTVSKSEAHIAEMRKEIEKLDKPDNMIDE